MFLNCLRREGVRDRADYVAGRDISPDDVPIRAAPIPVEAEGEGIGANLDMCAILKLLFRTQTERRGHNHTFPAVMLHATDNEGKLVVARVEITSSIRLQRALR